jgi:hypothetical protein
MIIIIMRLYKYAIAILPIGFVQNSVASLNVYPYALWAHGLTLTLLHHKGAESLLVHEGILGSGSSKA